MYVLHRFYCTGLVLRVLWLCIYNDQYLLYISNPTYDRENMLNIYKSQCNVIFTKTGSVLSKCSTGGWAADCTQASR